MLAINDATTAKSDEIERRLLSAEGRRTRIILIDNIKSLKFSWQWIEANITSTNISGRQMFIGEGKRPNNLTIIITANGATLSKDMASRCMVTKLARPQYSAGDWDDAVTEFITKHRWDVLADLRRFFDMAPTRITTPSRWGQWQRAIVARLDEPGDAQRALQERAKEYDEDEEEMELVRSEIRGEISWLGHNPDKVRVKISARALAGLVIRATGEKRRTNHATAYARQLQIPEMQGRSRRGGRFYYWNGKDTGANDRVTTTIDSVNQADIRPTEDG